MPLDVTKIAALRESQDFAAVGVKQHLFTVPVRRPRRTEFIRVRPGDEWTLRAPIFEDKGDRGSESYLLDPSLLPELGAEVTLKQLYVAATRQNNIFFWPVRLPDPDGRQDSWSASAQGGAELARTEWTRISANMKAGYYDLLTATGNLSEPVWPEDKTFDDLLGLAFRDRYIENHEHPVLARLRGEI